MDLIKVMLIDDEMPVRDAYSRWLQIDGRAVVVAEAEDQTEALQKLHELLRNPSNIPDVIALDLGIPKNIGKVIDPKGGINIIPKIKEISPKSRILMVTQGTDEDPIIEAFSAGADGYIWKNETGDAIASAIKRVSEGKLVASIAVAEKILGMFKDLSGRDYSILPRKRKHKKLTELLYRTMKLYCYDGLSAQEIAEREYVSLDGVNSRIKKAKQILGVSTRRQAFRIMTDLSDDNT